VLDRYRQALDQLRKEGRDSSLVVRMSELIALVEIATAPSQDKTGEEILEEVLRIVMSGLQVERAALFVARDDGALALRVAHGLTPAPPFLTGLDGRSYELVDLHPDEDPRVRFGLELICPIHRHGRRVAAIALGRRADDQAYGADAREFLRDAAGCAAARLERGSLQDELRQANQKLSVKVFALHNLFDLSRELVGSFDEEALHGRIATMVMAHFVVSRSALFLLAANELRLVHSRGLRREMDDAVMPAEEAQRALADLRAPLPVRDVPSVELRTRLEQARLAFAIPLVGRDGPLGLLAIGERASGIPFSAEDREFAQSLARHAVAALENARLQKIRTEKERQDRELQMAREIQRSLFPACPPAIPGFELAGDSRPCYEVGGDAYDWIPLPGDRLALVIADVSGKGTPASLLMASVHASLQALAGTATPTALMERLNRFLYVNTQASRFVTLFYAELDPATRRLEYVNAGHVPPCRIAADGSITTLAEGGPALGLMDRATYGSGRVTLDRGDIVAVVTDGVTEARSPDDQEFGDDRLYEVLRSLSGRPARVILEGLSAAVEEWTASAAASDDRTALIVKAL
jgi:phosphoserine phosphatase RsbU/P